MNFGKFHEFWKISQILENFTKFGKLKKHKFALISETVEDREKRTKFWDHMHCQ